MNGFTKLYSSILTSSIWSEDDKTRIMWITILASSDAQGVVVGTIPGMAAMARMSIEDAEKAINRLSEPDKYSKTRKHKGARVIKSNQGWTIVSYRKHRVSRDPEKRKAQNREAQRVYREKKRVKSKPAISHDKPRSAQAEAEAEADTNTKRHSISVRFDYENRNLTGLTDKDYAEWKEAFPAVDIRHQIKSARQWLIDNPTKRKTQIRRFLTNWLRRCQERGGDELRSNSEQGNENIRDSKKPYIR